jgi:uncharacterized protein (TIGR00730 family)
MINKRVCVFCASSSDVDPFYLDEAERLGKELAESGREIIYGGGNIGLMGRLADGSLSNGGFVIGVIPTFLDSLELGHTGCQQLIQVEDMHTREKRMITDSDCIVTLPGGCGTFEELLQAVTWKRLGLIISPIIIVNLKNYFDPLIEMLERAVEQGFMRNEYLDLWQVADSIDETMEIIKTKKKSPKHDILPE